MCVVEVAEREVGTYREPFYGFCLGNEGWGKTGESIEINFRLHINPVPQLWVKV